MIKEGLIGGLGKNNQTQKQLNAIMLRAQNAQTKYTNDNDSETTAEGYDENKNYKLCCL